MEHGGRPSGGGAGGGAPAGGAPSGMGGAGPAGPGGGPVHGLVTMRVAAPVRAQGGAAVHALALHSETALARFGRFEDVVALIRRMRDVKLLVEVENHLRLVSYAPGRIEFQPTEDAPRDLAATLSQRLQGWTGARWGVSVVSEGGGETLAEIRDADQRAAEEEARSNPVIQAIFAAFPGARFEEITNPDDLAAELSAEALPEVEDEWDPFEDN